MTNSRDIGLPGVGAGKGSSPRTRLDANYRERFKLIRFDRTSETIAGSMPGSGFVEVRPGRFRKTFK